MRHINQYNALNVLPCYLFINIFDHTKITFYLQVSKIAESIPTLKMSLYRLHKIYTAILNILTRNILSW